MKMSRSQIEFSPDDTVKGFAISGEKIFFIQNERSIYGQRIDFIFIREKYKGWANDHRNHLISHLNRNHHTALMIGNVIDKDNFKVEINSKPEPDRYVSGSNMLFGYLNKD